MLTRRLLAIAGTAALVFAACSSGGGTATTAPSPAGPSASAGGSSPSASASASAGPSLPTAADLGSTQGQSINVLAWPGYVENGSTDKTVDWVTDFQNTSGCKVNPQIFGTSDEAYTLF